MDSHENTNHPPPRTASLKFFIIYALPILFALFIAISFDFTRSNFFKTQFLRLSFSPSNGNFLGILHRNPFTRSVYDDNRDSPNPRFCVLWMAPFLSVGGYSSEAWSYITAIQNNVKNPLFSLAIEQHGDLVSIEFWEGLPESMRKLALQLHETQTQCKKNETIVICHSEPGAWNPPLFETSPCPPSAHYGDFMAVIGRTMFETDRVNHDHVDRCNKMDYVWVPTDFHVSTFVKSGVESSKVIKLVQSIDVEFFDPFKYEPIDLVDIRELALGKPYEARVSQKEFVFLSIFKWEFRKGWDVLLRAYLEEFLGIDGVTLYLLTNPFHTNKDFSNKIVEFVEHSGIQRPIGGWAPVYVIDKHIAQVDLPRLYKSADAFVLPSRGEGWGRPIVEAMSMSLPVIATNWSGPTEYLTEENGFPLAVDNMSEVVEGPFKGHLWAEPSVDKLRCLMREVMSNVEEARVRGRRAREDMISRFSPKNVEEMVTNLINTVVNERA